MCTAISYNSQNHYFGRNLDLEYHYNETVAITPRDYSFPFRNGKRINHHYAMIGMAIVEDGYPLYYDATNEWGLSMAGLNFPGNAVYFPESEGKDNIAPFELIPWVLGQCKNLQEAKKKFAKLNISKITFSEKYPLSPLHWMVSDSCASLVLEQTENGLAIHDNPLGVLTNNPPFPYHLYNLQNYLNVTAKTPENRFSETVCIVPYSRGMGGIGLPGDLSSSSRFVRAAFTKLNSVDNGSEESSVSQFFHILEAVAQQRGCCQVGNSYEITQYSSCCNTATGTYYYKTYDNPQISAVRLTENLMQKDTLSVFPLVLHPQICFQN